jgi:hypothetical protein
MVVYPERSVIAAGHVSPQLFTDMDPALVFEPVDGLQEDCFVFSHCPRGLEMLLCRHAIAAEMISAFSGGKRHAATGAKRRLNKMDPGCAGQAERMNPFAGQKAAAGDASRGKDQVSQSLEEAFQFTRLF